MRCNMHEAKTRLSELVEAAERGEDVVICRAGRPAVRLVPAERADTMRLGLLADAPGPAIAREDVKFGEDELRAWGLIP